MQRFKNILVVVDDKTDHDAVLERAVTLGQKNQARLMVVNVVKNALSTEQKLVTPEPPEDVQESGIEIIEELSRDTSWPIISAPLAEVQEPIRDAVELSHQAYISAPSKPAVSIQEYIIEEDHHDLEQAVAAIRQAGVQVSSKVLCGTPFLEIIREVLCNKHDLVVIAAEGQSRLKEMLFGSTTMHLMRKCPCPVWVLKPTQPKRYNRILAALDPMPNDERPNMLNTKIMELATSLARIEQSKLLIAYTWTVHGESILRSRRNGFPKQEVNKIVQENRNVHRRWLTKLLQQHSLEDLKYQAYMLNGEAGALIPELAKKMEVDLIVMGTVAHGGIADLLTGSTAEKILQQVDCSVMAVKPEGFVTPVKLDKERGFPAVRLFRNINHPQY